MSGIGRIGKTTNLKELVNGFRGRKFRELIQYHLARSSPDQARLQLDSTIRFTSHEVLIIGEGITDEYNRYAYQKEFWARDCAEVFQEICNKVSQPLIDRGKYVNEQEAFNIFQIIVLNFVTMAHENKKFRMFIGVKKGLFG